MVQPFNKPVRTNLREETVLRSGRNLQRPAGPAPVAMASDLATVGIEASALPAGLLAKPQAASELCTVLQAIATSSQRLADATVTLSAASARTTLPPPFMAEIPDFTGIDQDPTVWLNEIHSLTRRHALTDDVTLSLARALKVLPAVPLCEDHPDDMILGADFLLSDDIELTIRRGHVELRSSTAGTTATTLPPPTMWPNVKKSGAAAVGRGLDSEEEEAE
ncbi:hypothetical protein HPB51_020621 [Rhipicephalus microplus]|uniref:Uncharacterized protein n=1 Tax=Rhipicephalus microplus TaxID=6941 RepID=A0A9J6DJ34_RHIMP|nr:hypothetical protein HPB51_020621 [Rhipicephalus microplus]